MGLLSKLRQKRLARLRMRKKASQSCTTVAGAAHPASEESPSRVQGVPYNPRSSIGASCTAASSSCSASAASMHGTAFPVGLFVPDEKSDTPPQRAYISLSSDLRILSVRTNQDPPSSLLDFRHPTLHFKLARIADTGVDECSPSKTLEEYVADRVAPVSHESGPAIRISEEGRSIQLVAGNEEERNHWLSALCLRLAPRCVVRDRLEAEIRSIVSLSTSRISVAAAFREVIKLDDENIQQNPEEREGESVCSPPLAHRLWKTLGTTAQTLNWTSSFGQAIAGSADIVEKLAKPFCRMAVVGSALSLISLSARTVHLLATEREGRHKLEIAREDLESASVSVCEWLVEILETGFQDESLIGTVFDAIEKCWDVAAEVEQFVLRNWAVRVWNAEEVEAIERKVGVIQWQLSGVGVLRHIAKLEQDVGNVKEELEKMKMHSGPVDNFRSSFPDPVQFSAGLMLRATAITLAQLKSRIIRLLPIESGAENTNSGDKVVRVALKSVSGEDGVGKTSTCKLLCADSDVRNHFSGGAILWITLGVDVSDSQVNDKISAIVADCGGLSTAEKVGNCESVEKAVNLARRFFSSHRILLVLDNVWKPAEGSQVGDWLSTLSRIVTCPGSVILMTTRFDDLSSARGVDRIRLERLNIAEDASPDWEVAEALYDQQLALEPNNNPVVVLLDEYKRTRRQALKLTCGLPLAIATFCGLIRLRGSDAMDVLSLIEKKSCERGLASRSTGRESAVVVGHVGLHYAICESLQFLDNSEGKERMFRMVLCGRRGEQFSSNYSEFGNRPVSSRYTALEAMDNSSGTFAFTVLAHLWHLKSAEDAEDLCRMFANIGLGRIESLGPKRGYAFSLHDLQYEFCEEESRRSFVNGHHLLLSGCMPLFKTVPDWVPFCMLSEITDRGDGHDPRISSVPEELSSHMTRNIFRHLCRVASGNGGDANSAVKEMIRLLTDFRWVRGRGCSHGRAGVVSDLKTALSFFSAGKEHLFEVHQSIRLIKRVVELVPESLFRSLSSETSTERELIFDDGQLASHLVGRLDQALHDGWGPSFDVEVVKSLIVSVHQNVWSDWIRPGYGFFAEIVDDPRLEIAVSVCGYEEQITSVADFGDGIHVASGYSDGTVRIHNIEIGATALSFESGENGKCGALFVTVRASLMETSYLLYHAVMDVVYVANVAKDATGRITVVARSTVGRVAAGSLGSFALPPSEWSRRAGLSHPPATSVENLNSVMAMSVSRNGTRIVVGDKNGVIYIWTRFDESNSLDYEMTSKWDLALAPPDVSVTALSASRNLALFACGPKGSLIWSDIMLEEDLHADTVHAVGENSISYISFSPHGCLVAIGVRCHDHWVVEVWDISSKRRRCRTDAITGEVHCFSFVQQSSYLKEGEQLGDRLLIGVDTSVHVHDLTKLEYVDKYVLTANPFAICSTTAADGKQFIVVACEGGFLSVFDAAKKGVRTNSWTHLRNAPRQDLGEVTTITFSRKQHSILCGHECGAVSVWCSTTGKFVDVLKEKHSASILLVDVIDDQRLVIAGSIDGPLRVWDWASRRCKFVLKTHVHRENILGDNIRILCKLEIAESYVRDLQTGATLVGMITTAVDCTCSEREDECFCRETFGNVMFSGHDMMDLASELTETNVMWSTTDRERLDVYYADKPILYESVRSMIQNLASCLWSSNIERRLDGRACRKTAWYVNKKSRGLEFRHPCPTRSGQVANVIEARINLRTKEAIASCESDNGRSSSSCLFAYALSSFRRPVLLRFEPGKAGCRNIL